MANTADTQTNPKLANKPQARKTMSRMGEAIRSLNALAVGTLAAFSLEKTLVIFGVIAAGTLPMGWPLAAMIVCGLAITAITYSMYHQDSWRIMGDYCAHMWTGIKESWKKLWRKTNPEQIKSTQPGQSGFLSVDVYGHLGGAIKFLMAFAGLWLLAYGSVAFLPLIALMVMVGAAQYFAEASVLIPHSRELFTAKPNEKASPTNKGSETAFTSFKWVMVVAHALGQGLGFFACMALFGTLPVPLMLAIGVMAMLIIGPSTGRFYGERFFRWGSTVTLAPEEQGYGIPYVHQMLEERKVSTEEITDARQKLGISRARRLEIDGDSHTAEASHYTREEATKLLRYFGYYLDDPIKLPWKDMTWYQKAAYSIGGMVGCFGAAFKGALAFAGAVGFLLLVTVGTLAITTTPPGWIIGVAGFIGVSTWMVQCSRACPNTADGFVSWTVKKQAEHDEAGFAHHEGITMNPLQSDRAEADGSRLQAGDVKGVNIPPSSGLGEDGVPEVPTGSVSTQYTAT